MQTEFQVWFLTQTPKAEWDGFSIESSFSTFLFEMPAFPQG